MCKNKLDRPAGKGCAKGWRKVVSPLKGKTELFQKKITTFYPKTGSSGIKAIPTQVTPPPFRRLGLCRKGGGGNLSKGGGGNFSRKFLILAENIAPAAKKLSFGVFRPQKFPRTFGARKFSTLLKNPECYGFLPDQLRR